MSAQSAPISLSPSAERLKYHFQRYFPTLVEFEQYQSLIFLPGVEVPPHVAYLCPLCLNNCLFIIKDDNLYATSEFDDDHFPPESVGGSDKILVCKPCNSDAGRSFDFVFKKALHHRSYALGLPNATLELRAKISTIRGNYRGAISIDPDQQSAVAFFHNKKTPFLNAWMESSTTDRNYSIELTVFKLDNEKFGRALVKTAYLYCFQFWGYSFAYSVNGENMRKVLAGVLDYPIKSVASFQLENKDVSLPAGLCFLTEPAPWRTYAVNIHVVLKETGYRCTYTVLIPPPTENGWEELAAIGRLLETRPETSVTMVKLLNRCEQFLAQGGSWIDKHH